MWAADAVLMGLGTQAACASLLICVLFTVKKNKKTLQPHYIVS